MGPDTAPGAGGGGCPRRGALGGRAALPRERGSRRRTPPWTPRPSCWSRSAPARPTSWRSRRGSPSTSRSSPRRRSTTSPRRPAGRRSCSPAGPAAPGADVFQAWDSHFWRFAANGVLVNINDLLKDFKKADLDDFVKGQWNGFQIPETNIRFGLPTYINTGVLYYNKNTFQKAGVKEPDATWTYNDYAEASKRLTRTEGGRQVYGTFHPLGKGRIENTMWAYGGTWVDPKDFKKSAGHLPECPGGPGLALRPLLEGLLLATRSSSARPASPSSPRWATGWSAMAEEGMHALKDVARVEGMEFDIAPVPKGPKQRMSWITTDGWGIWSGSERAAPGVGVHQVPGQRRVVPHPGPAGPADPLPPLGDRRVDPDPQGPLPVAAEREPQGGEGQPRRRPAGGADVAPVPLRGGRGQGGERHPAGDLHRGHRQARTCSAAARTRSTPPPPGAGSASSSPPARGACLPPRTCTSRSGCCPAGPPAGAPAVRSAVRRRWSPSTGSRPGRRSSRSTRPTRRRPAP